MHDDGHVAPIQGYQFTQQIAHHRNSTRSDKAELHCVDLLSRGSLGDPSRVLLPSQELRSDTELAKNFQEGLDVRFAGGPSASQHHQGAMQSAMPSPATAGRRRHAGVCHFGGTHHAAAARRAGRI